MVPGEGLLVVGIDHLWPIDQVNGIRLGSPLNDLLVRRFLLSRQREKEDDDGCEWWEDADAVVSAVVCDGLVALVNHRDRAFVAEHQLIDMHRVRVAQLIGAPNRVDEVDGSWVYGSGPRELSLGFVEDVVSWVCLSDDHLLDQQRESTADVTITGNRSRVWSHKSRRISRYLDHSIRPSLLLLSGYRRRDNGGQGIE